MQACTCERYLQTAVRGSELSRGGALQATKGIKKAAAQRSLDALAEKGHLRTKVRRTSLTAPCKVLFCHAAICTLAMPQQITLSTAGRCAAKQSQHESAFSKHGHCCRSLARQSCTTPTKTLMCLIKRYIYCPNAAQFWHCM
jgi:hypothetical protein